MYPVVIRDPIHGDIEVSPVCGTVVDHIAFQRLRYVRQNGLLHMIWPSAVHTRFAHSIGTMHIARKAFHSLFLPLSDREHDLNYLRELFTTAALLHDVGHCAFSHSIESVTFQDRLYLGRAGRVAEDWQLEEIFEDHLVPILKDTMPSQDPHELSLNHELLGFFFIAKIFQDDAVGSIVSRELNVQPSLFGQDVNCLLEHAPPSLRLKEEIIKLKSDFAGACEDRRLFGGALDASDDEFVDGIINSLHSLISGTLDVDRLDYLQRDSHFCGVPYGMTSEAMLVRNLRIGANNGKPSLGLQRKALHCFEDMLWSRYQMYLQVYGHKTNVGLNSLLEEAIQKATEDGILTPPSSYREFLTFTDDSIMAAVIPISLAGSLENTPYAHTLVNRRLPAWLDMLVHPSTAEVHARRESLASEKSVPLEFIRTAESRSNFVKEGPLPVLIERDGNISSIASASRLFDPNEGLLSDYRVHFFQEQESAA